MTFALDWGPDPGPDTWTPRSVDTSSAVAGVAPVARPWGDREGAGLLDDVERFLARFVAYPSEATRVATVLWAAHAHALDAFEHTPRLAFLSPEPGSGKTRALEVLELVTPNPLLAVNATPAYLFRKIADTANRPTILFDEPTPCLARGPRRTTRTCAACSTLATPAAPSQAAASCGQGGGDRGATCLRCGGPGRARRPTGHRE